jgi:hypothetical protein
MHLRSHVRSSDYPWDCHPAAGFGRAICSGLRARNDSGGTQVFRAQSSNGKAASSGIRESFHGCLNAGGSCFNLEPGIRSPLRAQEAGSQCVVESQFMARTVAFCVFGLVTENDSCPKLAAYRIEARTNDGRRVVLHLCSDHIHRAWHLAQIAIDKKFPGENLRVRSIHLHQLQRVSAAEAAS